MRAALLYRYAMLLSSADRRLPERLLPKTDALHPLLAAKLRMRRLLPQAAPLRPMFATLRWMQRLLPQAFAQFLLAPVRWATLRAFLPQVRSAKPSGGRSSNQHGEAQWIDSLETKSAMTAIVRSLIPHFTHPRYLSTHLLPLGRLGARRTELPGRRSSRILEWDILNRPRSQLLRHSVRACIAFRFGNPPVPTERPSGQDRVPGPQSSRRPCCQSC
jgi:hypothetical protein